MGQSVAVIMKRGSLRCACVLVLLVARSRCGGELFFAGDGGGGGGGLFCRNATACHLQLPCQLFDNVTCILDPRDNCRPRFISQIDGSEVTCSENDRIYCSADNVQLSCPEKSVLKLWSATFLEMESSYCFARTEQLSSRPLRHCTYAASPDDTRAAVYSRCDGRPNCTFRWQQLADPLCDGQAYWTSGLSMLLRLDHQCVSELHPSSMGLLWSPLLWILLPILLATAVFGTVVCFDCCPTCKGRRNYFLNRRYWNSIPLLGVNADFV